jgi:hypothetical protein
MKHVILAVSAAVFLAGTTYASAQVYRDDPPGSAFQSRGVIEEKGENPYRYSYPPVFPPGAYRGPVGNGYGYGPYRGPYGYPDGAYGAYGYAVPGPRYRRW